MGAKMLSYGLWQATCSNLAILTFVIAAIFKCQIQLAKCVLVGSFFFDVFFALGASFAMYVYFLFYMIKFLKI